MILVLASDWSKELQNEFSLVRSNRRAAHKISTPMRPTLMITFKNTMTRNYCPAQFFGIKQIKIVLFQKIQRTLNYQKETKCKGSNVSEVVIIRLPIQGQH